MEALPLGSVHLFKAMVTSVPPRHAGAGEGADTMATLPALDDDTRWLGAADAAGSTDDVAVPRHPQSREDPTSSSSPSTAAAPALTPLLQKLQADRLQRAAAAATGAAAAAAASTSAGIPSTTSGISTKQPTSRYGPSAVLPLRRLPATHDLFGPYSLEGLAASVLLSAAHAHVAYRFVMSDPQSRALLQLVVTNWDLQISAAGLAFPAGGGCDSKDGSVFGERRKRTGPSGARFHTPAVPSTPGGGPASPMLPAVKVAFRATFTGDVAPLFRCGSDEGAGAASAAASVAAAPAAKEATVIAPSATAPADAPEAMRRAAGWAAVFGAQRLLWTVGDVLELTRVLNERSALLPPSLQTLGAPTGFRFSYLLRTSRHVRRQAVQAPEVKS